MTNDKPKVQHLAVGLLYFNKQLIRFERQLHDAMTLAVQQGVVGEITYIERHGMAVDMARNAIVTDALDRDCDAIAWLDTDLVFHDNALASLLDMSNAGWPVAGGVYRRNVPPHHELLVRRSRASTDWATLDELKAHEEGGVTRVYTCAGGFSIVKADVYRRFRDALGMPWYCNWDWWTHDQCGEDTFFMRRLDYLGIPVVVDSDLRAVHWGLYGPIPVVPDQPEMALC